MSDLDPNDIDSTKPPARHETRTALVQLLLVLAAGFFASLITGVTNTVIVLLAVVIMVMLHEFGHYITAKWSGMKVEQFFLGFGPRLWSIKRGETEYGIRAIPAGGFVKVIGMSNLEEVDPSEESRAFRSSPVWRRVVMASAGTFMHYVMAFAISFVLLAFVGLPTASTTVASIVPLQTPSPAQIAGVQAGDEIVEVDGKVINEWSEAIAVFAQPQSVGRPLGIVVDRGGQRVPLTVTPVDRRDVVLADGSRTQQLEADQPSGFIGIQSKTVNETMSPIAAIGRSFKALGTGTKYVFEALGERFSPTGLRLYFENVMGTVAEDEQEKADENRFVSPVGLVNVADDAANSGLFAVLTLLFSLNLFIGIFNMIPLMPFDGGHVAVALYEKVRSFRRPNYHVDYAKLLPVSYAVILVLLVISGTSLWLDVVRPQENPFE